MKKLLSVVLAVVMLVGLLPVVSFAETVNGFQYASVGIDEYGGYVLSADGKLWTWGFNSTGRLGTGNKAHVSKPVNCMNGIKDYAQSYNTSVFLKQNGSLWTCGRNTNYGLGKEEYDGKVEILEPVHILDNIQSLEFAGKFIGAIDNNNALWIWGGETGSIVNAPKKIITDVKRAIDIYDGAIFIVKNDGTLWGYGNNQYGLLGEYAYRGHVTEPVKLLDAVDKISYYNASVAVICKDKTLWTWGDNDAGQIGNGKKRTLPGLLCTHTRLR